jgi:phospholipase/carboxylesterase
MTDKNSPKLVDNGPGYEQTGLVHRVLEPGVDGPHPTVVMLHGRSGNEDVMWVFQRALPKDWLVVAPRAIKTDPDGGYAWHPRQRDEWPSLAMFDEAVTAVVQFIHALSDLYNADPDQIYLMGFSQGAATSYASAMQHPGLIKGIAGLVGFMPVDCQTAVETAALSNLPILMIVGLEDETIPPERSKKCAETVQAAGADLTYKEYETGHRLNAQGMRDLKNWWVTSAGIGHSR